MTTEGIYENTQGGHEENWKVLNAFTFLLSNLSFNLPYTEQEEKMDVISHESCFSE